MSAKAIIIRHPMQLPPEGRARLAKEVSDFLGIPVLVLDEAADLELIQIEREADE